MWQPDSGRSVAAGHGAQGGVGIGSARDVTIHLSGPGPLVSSRSAYLAQVRRIAPPVLLDRQPELAELARFCLDEHRGPYVWWRAGPWAGKSALLSTFVLHPPPPVQAQVQVVAFFITARLAAQDTRAAFTAVVAEQLAALTDQQPPPVIDKSTREAWLLDLLEQAAAACQRRGVRLVLVVDGLDEDRGVTTGPDANSIAGLLPADPPAGMRIIVAGRPNPPIPDDVTDWHPLRDPRIIRLLADSPHARDLQRLGQTELKRLLKGTDVERDLLGLLTAARGGLSGPDLHELTGASLVDIEDVLHTVVGRTFTRRLDQWAPQIGPEMYLLGHEELHNAAVYYFGPDRLSEYRERLHAWADTYRLPGDCRQPWPSATPEYLLRGYPRMLEATGEVGRLVVLATDPTRHDRMLDLSGGDAAALAEIKTTQDRLLTYPEPDLLALARLSIHRHDLESRNANMPTDLPAVWAALGHPARAESLARGIADAKRQGEALTEIAREVAAAGEPERAVRIARGITDPGQRRQAAAEVVRVTVAAGEHERAERIARTITDPHAQAEALTEVARTVAAAFEYERAERIARTITDPHAQADALTEVARIAAAAADYERATQIARTIVNAASYRLVQENALAEVARMASAAGGALVAQTARAITNPYRRALVLTNIARQASGTGVPRPGLDEAVYWIPRMFDTPGQQAQALAAVAVQVAAAGEPGLARRLSAEAEQLARRFTDPYPQARALTAAAQMMASADEPARARQLATEAEQIARTITDVEQQARALTTAARVLASAGEPARARQLATEAEQIARTITDPEQQARALAAAARAVADAGEPAVAGRLAERVYSILRAIPARELYAQMLGEVAEAVASAGQPAVARLAAAADQIARANIGNPYTTVEAISAVVREVAIAGEPERAEQIARTLPSFSQAQALTVLVSAVAADGPERAARIARTITDPVQQAQALAEVTQALAAAGKSEQALRIAGEAEQAARTIPSHWRGYVAPFTAVAEAMAIAGEPQRARRLAAEAEQILAEVTEPRMKRQARLEVARTMVAVGDRDRAEQLTLIAEQDARATPDPGWRTEALAEVARAVADIGDPGRAAQVVRDIADPYQRARALAEVTQVLADAGEPELARQLATEAAQSAHDIPDPHQQAQALTDVARAVGPPAACRLLGEAFAVGSWLLPLPLLARLRPSLVIQIVDEVYGTECSGMWVSPRNVETSP